MHTLTSLFPLRRMRRAMLREKIFAHCAPCHSTKPGENKRSEPGRVAPGARQVRPRHEDDLLRAGRERPAGRYRLSEDAAEITGRSRQGHENQDSRFAPVRLA
jgi:hypothetical protein